MNELNRMAVDLLASSAVQGEKIENIEAQLSDIKRDVRDIRATLIGNGTPGITTRLDRVEQKHKLVSRITWLLVAAAMGVVAQHVWSVMS